MAATDFAALNTEQKIIHGRRIWKAARDAAFVNKFIGDDTNSFIQRITDLTKDEKGERVIIPLVQDLVQDGVTADNQRDGREEALDASFKQIQIDMLHHAITNKGRLADQKTVLNARALSRDRLSYWLANRIDQLAILTLSGVSYAFNTNGSARTDTAFSGLSFAADVTAPSAKRSVMFDGTSLIPSNTANITTSFLPSYKMIVKAVAYAKDHYIRGVRVGGKEQYMMLVRPGTLGALKLDADIKNAVVTAKPRSESNPFFAGGLELIDGVVIHETNLVYNTTGTATKWGAGNAIEGTRSLLLGAQALGMADLEAPLFDEETYDQNNKWRIWVDKMFGLVKPTFKSIYDGSVEDFGVLAIDHHLPS